MKTSKTLSVALAVAMAFVAGQAMASSGNTNRLTLAVSGTVKIQDLQGADKGTTASHSLSEKFLYNVISNAVAGTTTGYATNLPKDGYIVYNPYGEDDMVQGTFYVTNKDGFYYPLSGYDTNDDYYSFMELDTVLFDDSDFDGFFLGFFEDQNEYYLFFCINSYNFNNAGNGSMTDTTKATLYVHDNPYLYADSGLNNTEGLYPFDDQEGGNSNSNAFEITGILTANFTFKGGEITNEHLSLSGSGNFFLDGNDIFGDVTSGHATFSE